MIKEIQDMISLTPARQKAVLDHYTTDELQYLQKNIADLVQRRKEQEELEKLELQERQEKAKIILAQMAELGISIEDLDGDKKPKSKIPPKYKLEKNGEIHTWTGRGRTPKVFVEYEKQHGKGSLSQLETDDKFILTDFMNEK